MARLGSFSRASREPGISQPSASRILALLEAEAGTAPLTRITRGSADRRTQGVLARIKPLLDAPDDANHAGLGKGVLRGGLRVALPTSATLRAVILLLRPSLAIDAQAGS
jgi:DNA-binding transcriptional LysR family regulator